MPVTQSSDDSHIPSTVPGGNLKRTHPLRVSFLHSHGHNVTSSEDTAQNNAFNFTRGHAHRQTTPNTFGQLPSSQNNPTRSQSHQHLGLIDGNGHIRHYCPFHGPVKPHVHEVTHTLASHLGHLNEDGHDGSIFSSASSDTEKNQSRSERNVDIALRSKRSKLDGSLKRPVTPKQKKCWQWMPLQHALLISCYALLLLLAVLVGVVVSQSHRLSNRRRQPVQGGAIQIRRRPGTVGLPQGPPPRIGGRRRPQAVVPVPPPPPTTTTTTEQALYDYEYDYEYLDSQSSVPAPPPPPTTSTTFQPLPPPTTSRPVKQLGRQQNVGRPVDRQTFRKAASPPPRRQGVSLANIDQDFTLDNEQGIRGRKEPTVQIARAWSHQNPDGTFTWGYINTDGSFKNETKGADCVVRGSYGYVDEATGEQVVVPYETGNPCNPDDLVYDYADYDVQGFLSSVRGGVPEAAEQAPAPRRPLQQQQQLFDSSGSLRNRQF